MKLVVEHNIYTYIHGCAMQMYCKQFYAQTKLPFYSNNLTTLTNNDDQSFFLTTETTVNRFKQETNMLTAQINTYIYIHTQS